MFPSNFSVTNVWFLCGTLCIFSVFTFGQSKTHELLRELDSLAFSALENDDSNAEEAASALLEESLKLPPSFFQVNAHTILGILHKNRGYYVTALSHYLKSLEVAEKLVDKGRISACLNNIGSVYHRQGNYPEALSYYEQSLDIERTLNQPLQKSIRLYNIGDVYKEIDSLDLSLAFFTNSLIIEKKFQNKEGINYASLGIAHVYLKSARVVDAERVLRKIGNALKGTSFEERILWLERMGELSEQKNDQDAAIDYFNQAEQLCVKHHFRNLLPELIMKQIVHYENARAWKQASLKYRQYTQLNEELNSVLIKNQLADLTFQNALNKKEVEIELMQSERDSARRKAESETRIRRYESRIVWLLLTTIAIVVLFVFFLHKFRSRSLA